MSEFKGEVKSTREHVLLRPDTYISSVVTADRKEWIACNGDDGDYFVRKSLPYNRGLFNIIREIGSNIVDNKWRSEKVKKKMTDVSITLNSTTGEISFRNNGYPIPVEKVTYEYKNDENEVITKVVYPAEIFFGKMLAGTNFQDGQGRKTSGKNGMGSTLTNIFSRKFTVDHSDGKNRFYQEYTDNASQKSEPVITPCTESYTMITFTPDYKRFNYPSAESPGMDATLINLIRYYAYEMATMIRGVPIKLTIDGGEPSVICVKTLISYVKMHYPDSQNLIEFTNKAGDSIVLMERDVDLTNDILEIEQVEHRSYVNGILTKLGGVHLDAWRDKIIPKIRDAYNNRPLEKGAVKTKSTSKALYPYFMIFIRCELDDPAFDDQTKEYLNAPKPVLTGKEVSDADVKKIMKWEFVPHLEAKLLAKKSRSQDKVESGKIAGFGMKLKEAGWAGHKDVKKRMSTILFITEGLSAKTTSVNGTKNMENGHDRAGHYAIRGKFPSADRFSSVKLRENREVQHLIKILGLKFGLDYSLDENYHTLRYGTVMFYTDQDDDGFHIRGLLMRFFYKLFPSLVKRNFFSGGNAPNKWTSCIGSFSTPVVSAKIYGKKEPLLFYTNPEFKQWYSKNKDKVVKDSVNYYKGLGSIKPTEIARLYENPCVIQYFTTERDDDAMHMAFSPSMSSARKQWLIDDLNPCIEGGVVNESPETNNLSDVVQYTGPMSLETFINTQLKIYHTMSIVRALPGIYDGFKDSHRKIYYGVKLANHQRQVNVDMLVGDVLRNSGYHHDKKSLEDSITKMGQGFVGTNNIPLFENGGNFGSRIGGRTKETRDWAASRYIDSKLEAIHAFIFRKEDEPIYTRNYDNGKPVEFEYYVPIIPFILVNGASGIATGNCTSIPNYNPIDLVKAVKKWIKGGRTQLLKGQPLTPWYRGFTGEIELVKKSGGTPKNWTSRGIIEVGTGRDENNKKGYYHIRELPVGVWSAKFKDELEGMTVGKGGVKRLIDVNDRCDANTVHFRIKPVSEFIPRNSKKSINLESSNFMNFVAIDENGYPHKFESAEDIVDVFCQKRLDFYGRRKAHNIKSVEHEIEKLRNRSKFVHAVVTKKLSLYQDDENLEGALSKLGLHKISMNESDEPSYDYLLSMQARTFTKKKVDELNAQLAKAEANLESIKKTTPREQWLIELSEFEKAYTRFLKTRVEEPPNSKKKETKGKKK